MSGGTYGGKDWILGPKKHNYVKVCERQWKPWYNWVVFPFSMHMSLLLRSCCHITSILLLYVLIHQTSLNHILIQMHHSRIWFHLFSRELHGPMIDQSCLGIRAQWCVWLQILQAAWPTSRWTAGFDSKIIISTLGGKNKGSQSKWCRWRWSRWSELSKNNRNNMSVKLRKNNILGGTSYCMFGGLKIPLVYNN